MAVQSCSRPASVQIRRLALLPASVLIPDESLAWLRDAIPLILQEDLVTTKDTATAIVANNSGAYSVEATDEVQSTLEKRGSELQIHVDVRNLATQQTRNLIDGRYPDARTAADGIARQVDLSATPFPTRNLAALHAYVDAAHASDLNTRIQKLTEAVALDPKFGLAQCLLVGAHAQAGSPQLQDAIANAGRYRQSFTPLDGARFDSLMSRLRRQPLIAQLKAAATLVQVAPNDLEALSTLGVDQFLLGDGVGGEQSLSKALALNRGNPTLKQQLAIGLLQTRQFRRAESIWTQSDNAPGNLLSLAVCILLEGDHARANTAFEQYLNQRSAQADPLVPLARAQWTAMTSDTDQALRQLGESVLSPPDGLALWSAQQAVWRLQGRDTTGAQQSASQALRISNSPVVKQIATLVYIMASAGSADALRARVPSVTGSAQSKAILLGYGLFLYGDYAGAAEQWTMLLNNSGGVDLQSRAMLAACWTKLNRAGDTAKLNVEPFIPNLEGTDPFASVAFNAMLATLPPGKR